MPHDAPAPATCGFGGSSSRSTGGLVLLDIAQKSVPDLSVFTIDTGFLFPETLDLKARLEERYGFTIESVMPRQTIGEQAAEHGGSFTVGTPTSAAT